MATLFSRAALTVALLASPSVASGASNSTTEALHPAPHPSNVSSLAVPIAHNATVAHHNETTHKILTRVPSQPPKPFSTEPETPGARERDQFADLTELKGIVQSNHTEELLKAQRENDQQDAFVDPDSSAGLVTKLDPVVDFKRPDTPPEIIEGSKYDQIVREQIRERKAMSELGFVFDAEAPTEYQEYNGAPNSTMPIDFLIAMVIACAAIIAILALLYFFWKRIFREKPLESYTKRDNELMYLRDQQQIEGTLQNFRGQDGIVQPHVPVKYNSEAGRNSPDNESASSPRARDFKNQQEFSGREDDINTNYSRQQDFQSREFGAAQANRRPDNQRTGSRGSGSRGSGPRRNGSRGSGPRRGGGYQEFTDEV